MENPAQIDLHADRWVACIREIAFLAFDFTGASFAAQVRQTKDAAGTPLVNLGTVTSTTAQGVRLVYTGTDTIANHIAAGRLDEVPPGYQSTDVEQLSLVALRIAATTMQALPEPSQLGNDMLFQWDFLVTPSGGDRDKFAGGSFTVRAGVTQ